VLPLDTITAGDCLNLLPQIPSSSVDLILTDPPYGMAYQSSHRAVPFQKIAGDQSCEVFLQALPEMVRILRDDRHAYFFCSWHNVDVFKQAIEGHLTIKNIIVWVKNNHGAGDLKGAFAPKHELIIFAHKGRRHLRGKRLPDVLECPKVAGVSLTHPTEKPVPLLAQLIAASSEEGEIVLDPFIGTGATAAAAKNSGRRYIGMECDLGYVNIANNRLSSDA
jgi:site-specific DNA-methyltransferase (adenine-specific)